MIDPVDANVSNGESTAVVGRTDEDLIVVGVGASAGGLEALERFFSSMPPDSGMAFVIIQHLSPDFDSLMDQLLRQRTEIPIHRVTDGMVVEPDAVYLIPPKKEMIIAGGRLLLTDKDRSVGLTLPIDQFFRSLAQDFGRHCVGVVLSGTGSDGSRGIQEIRSSGGLVIVQDVDTAKFDGMPRSAIDTGTVNFILSPEEMPGELLRHIHHPDAEALADPIPEREEGMKAIFSLLRQEYNIDFSHYKPNTVHRRTERRLSINRSLDLPDYIEKLRTDPKELNALYRDLLIGVTSFFRDTEAFELLGTTAIQPAIAAAEPGQEVRIWCAGCATGEEPYSIAMLVHEELSSMDAPPVVKIFATDVHRVSLDFASVGVYEAAALRNLSAERRERYFTQTGTKFQVSPELRQLIVFAPHNIIKDAPFTKLDVVTCRNLLIYLLPLAQSKALSLFHFGLKAHGTLFLGPSENLAELNDEFESLNEHWKIYRKRRDVRLPADLRLPLLSNSLHTQGSAPATYSSGRAQHDALLMGAYDGILEAVVAPGVIVNDTGQLLTAFGGAEAYLQMKGGRSSLSILELVDDELRVALAGAMQRATKRKTPVVFKGVKLPGQENSDESVRLHVRPIQNKVSNSLYILISFEVETVGLQSAPDSTANHMEVSTDVLSLEQMDALETELQFTQENLQATIEELETSNEELQATNEELVASNEELQSTNEELHSVNEELYTVNAEYQRKIDELTQLTADMDNLLESTEIGTIFLDTDLCIRKFTPQIGKIFDLIPQDIGRRIDAFSLRLDHADLVDDVQQVLATQETLEVEVTDRNGRWYYLRVLPYRSEGRVDGIVLTLMDMTVIKDTQSKLKEKDRLLQTIVENSATMIFVKDLDGRYLLANPQCKKKLGIDGADALGQTDFDLLPEAVANKIRENDKLVLQTQSLHEFEESVPTQYGKTTFLSTKFPLRDANDRIYALGGISTDISRQKQAEQGQRDAVGKRDEFLAMLSHELRNPLGALINARHILSVATEVEDRKVAEEVLERQLDQMSRLLDDLLDVSRIQQNKINLQTSVVDLRESLEETLEALAPMLRARNQSLDCEILDVPLIIEGDNARLQQVFANLLTNASKYSPAGDALQLTLTKDGQFAKLVVLDHGAGMAPALLETVFDPFIQGASTLDRSNGGMGVGLTLARSIVELHGGQISAHSNGVEQGSRFEVLLPLSNKDLVAEKVAASAESRCRLNILLVEDNVDAAEMLGKILTYSGHTVRKAIDGKAGLNSIRTMPPNVAVVDIGLPLMNGYELARAVRGDQQLDEVFLVALTGYGRSEDREAAIEAGFDAHLVKPINISELQSLLVKVAESTR